MENKLIRLTLLLIMLIPLPQKLMAQGQVASRLIRGSNYQFAVGYEYQHVDLEDLNRLTTASKT